MQLELRRYARRAGEIADRLRRLDRMKDSFLGLTITDTGVGIAADGLPHVFDRFFRTVSADSMAAPGPGLGLAIVRSIIDAHHGSVHVASEPGLGTTVRVTLPRP